MRDTSLARPFRLAIAIGAIALLQACGTLGGRNQDDAPASGDGAAPLSFRVDVVSDNRRIARHLERYLDIQRFADFPDLQSSELRRLLGEAESNARDLLAALGYFSPTLKLTAGEPAGQRGTRRIVIEVDPGEQTKIASVDLRFAEPMDSDPAGEDQRRDIRRDWLLREDNPFTQEEWDASKTAGLRVLQRERYPTARISHSEATVNADTGLADLLVMYDAGAPYWFGSLRLEGVERYDEQGIRNIARIPTGRIYREEDLLDAQQRLVASGYFDSAFLLLDSSERNPDEATVIAQLREAKMQKIVFGLGFSTDAGARVSIDHTHNEMPPLGWRALNQLEAGLRTQSLATTWTDMPVVSGWAWNTGLKLERTRYGDIRANSASLNGGRSRSADRTERRYSLQLDASNSEDSNGPRSSSSLMAKYSWIGRYFNDRINPSGGFGLAADAGLGVTITPEREAFLRLNARGLKLWPFGGRNTAGKRSRIALRGEVGAVYSGKDVEVPATLLFLTGGDTTIRGYKFQSIGTVLPDGSTYGARYLATGSIEWQHPITVFGDARSFEHTLFVDAGTATDKVKDAVIYPGVGAGIRWSSPVGPLQFDVGYGTRSEKIRIHLRMGFQFL